MNSLSLSLSIAWEKLIAGRDGQCNRGLLHSNPHTARSLCQTVFLLKRNSLPLPLYNRGIIPANWGSWHTSAWCWAGRNRHNVIIFAQWSLCLSRRDGKWQCSAFESGGLNAVENRLGLAFIAQQTHVKMPKMIPTGAAVSPVNAGRRLLNAVFLLFWPKALKAVMWWDEWDRGRFGMLKVQSGNAIYGD